MSESGLMKRILEKVMEKVKETKKIGEDDPRRVIHSIKVGLALTIVSLFYYFRPLYDGFGQAGMWAILTVVVVFEFSVGGTISKSVNRGVATLVAAALGVGAEYLADQCGEKGEPIVLGLLVFVLATISTFTRFFPNVKRRYDYGVLIFILTFSLVAVSGARTTEILQLAHQRLSTILIGGATCIIISLSISPVWAGQDLHFLISANIANLAASLQGFGGEFSLSPCDGSGSTVSFKDDKEKSYLQSHKSVLNSKAMEESLANFAWWEPGHGRFKLNHPWKLYLNIGGLVRQCACQIETLSGSCIYINSKSQATSEFQQKVQGACVTMSIESSKALKELATSLKNATFPSSSSSSSSVEIHLHNSKAAADELKNIMEKSSFLPMEVDLEDMMPILVVASLLIDIIKLVEKISVSVNELAHKAGYKEIKSTAAASTDKQQPQLLHRGIVKPLLIDIVVVDHQQITSSMQHNRGLPTN
ncbi:aluminum activated malate transporter family protein [Perilla frutescens var. hirtella]|uniref:Aluminum activated malate transporter family protein n=1 Tax=Perilla frutescens var. hirtella TaxID=608512 RepID=A0AAD4P8U4_PERFH|nr:aluminum activated malate transporter family protein [Perilla frutescens var. hirtella]